MTDDNNWWTKYSSGYQPGGPHGPTVDGPRHADELEETVRGKNETGKGIGILTKEVDGETQYFIPGGTAPDGPYRGRDVDGGYLTTSRLSAQLVAGVAAEEVAHSPGGWEWQERQAEESDGDAVPYGAPGYDDVDDFDDDGDPVDGRQTYDDVVDDSTGSSSGSPGAESGTAPDNDPGGTPGTDSDTTMPDSDLEDMYGEDDPRQGSNSESGQPGMGSPWADLWSPDPNEGSDGDAVVEDPDGGYAVLPGRLDDGVTREQILDQLQGLAPGGDNSSASPDDVPTGGTSAEVLARLRERLAGLGEVQQGDDDGGAAGVVALLAVVGALVAGVAAVMGDD